MRIVFSKDRAAQLDLLLRSLDRYAPEERTTVIWAASSDDFERGYQILGRGYRPDVNWRYQDEPLGFESRLGDALGDADNTVTFFCDDDVLYRKIDQEPAVLLARLPEVLTFSLRLGSHVGWTWNWTRFPPHDYGYPGSA